MRLPVRKWGNSLAIRIPRTIAVESNLRKDSIVDLELVDGNLIIRPLRHEEYSLQALLDEVTEDNIHGEVDMGAPVGKEAW